MRSTGAAPSRRGSLGVNKSLGLEQRGPTSRSSLSFLAPVDEADEGDGATHRHSDEYQVRSFAAPAGAFFSSDEEIENLERQSRASATTRSNTASAKAPSRRDAETPRTRRISVASRRSLLRPPLQNVSSEFSRGRRESYDPSRNVIAATLNEKKQKKLIALFYWRRRTLETYLSAWKWAVFDAMPNGAPHHPLHELTLLRQYAPTPIQPVGMLDSISHHESALLRNTMRRQRSDSVVSIGRQSNHQDRMNSLRDEYRQLKATALDQQRIAEEVSNDPSQRQKEDAAAKRNAFRHRLRAFYRCFDAWREFLNERHAELDRLEERALCHYRRQERRKSFRSWAMSFLHTRRNKKRIWLLACERGDRLVKRRRLRSWMRLHNCCQLMHQRAIAVVRLRMAYDISRWHKWTVRTGRLRLAASRRRLIVLRRFFSRLKAHRLGRQHNKLLCDSAVALSDRSTLRRVWSQWYQTVFGDEGSSRMNALNNVLVQKSGVRKWKRFVARSRERQVRAEQADYHLYEGLLRRFWGRWHMYLSLRSEQRVVHDHATRHWTSQHKRRAIRALLSARCTRKYERDQCQGALEFYHHRIVYTTLVMWRAEATLLRRSQQFQFVRVKRQYVLCFVAWRQQAKQSGRANALGAALLCHHRAKVLRRSMQQWLYRQKVRAAFRILDSRYATRLLKKHLQLWRSHILHHRRWSEIVQSFRITQEVVYRRQILSVWHRIAVGSRCRRRLVLLFQKKHLCKKLRGCVQALAYHAKFQRLQRSISQRRLEGVWHAWVVYKSDQQRQSESAVAATRFYLARRYSLAVEMWKQNALYWIHTRQTSTTAVRFLIHRAMRTSLCAWYKRCQVWRRRRELIELRVAKQERSRLQQCFIQWNRAARVICRERHQFHQICCRAMLRRRERAFFTWRAHVGHKNARRQVLRDAQHRFALCRSHAILRAWRTTGFCLKRRRQAAQVVSSHWRRRMLGSTLVAWRVVTAEVHRDRMNTIKAASFHREFLLLWAFYVWQHAALERQVLQEKERRVLEAITKKQLGRAVAVWKRKVALRHDTKAKLLQVAALYRNKKRLRGIEAWCAFIGRRSERHAETKRALTVAASNLKRRIFGAWLRHTSGIRAFKRKLRAIFQTGEDSIQRRAFRFWRRYKRTITLERRADRWRRQSLQRIVLRHWRQQVKFSCKMRANVLITNRLLQSHASRTSFTRWKRFVELHQQSLRAHVYASAHDKERCYRFALRRFRVAVRHARAAELSTTFHVKHVQRQQFMNWRRGIIAQKKRRAQKVSIAKRYRVLRVKNAFAGWKQLVQAKLLLLQAKAQRFSNSLALRHTWKTWKRVVHCQHLAENFVVRRIKRELHTSFRDWIQFAQEQTLIRCHVEAAVAHVDRVIKQKIWERWIQFRSERQEHHRLEHTASSFYATSILLRRYFQAWSTHLTRRNEKQAQQLKAEAFCSATSLRKCLDHWEMYVAHRHSRAATKIAENEAIRKVIAGRTICKWHDRASALLSLAAAETRARKYVTQRAETSAIHKLLEHAAAKKTKRKCQADAITYRTSQLGRQCLTRWKDFLMWRRRHRHLLRLFRSNQQNDYFALWRKYVATSQRKRVLQATATRGYRNIVQRSALTQWGERCHYWRDKRRAIQWHNQRLGRCVLEVWAHRVRVLRQMRHMFRFQDSFRLETHFHTWKRYWWRNKQQIVRVQDAVVWFKKHREGKCFALWNHWIEVKRQEKQTLRMAIGFRKRFFSRKYLRAWRSVIAWKKRKAWLAEEALRCFCLKLLHRAFDKLCAFAKLKKRVSDNSLALTEVLTVMRVQRSVDRWIQHLLKSREKHDLGVKAADHHRHVMALQIWCHLRRWHAVCQVKRAKLKRAQHHCELGSCRRTLLAWVVQVRNQHRLRNGLQRFKDRYFRGVVDDCFSRWFNFVKIKRQLRQLKHKVERSRQRHALDEWRTTTQDSRTRQTALTAIQTHRNFALLRRCVMHWEGVTTETWMYKRLVSASVRRRERQAKCCVLQRWEALLPLRRARKEWRERGRVRYKHLLVTLLRQWRWRTVEVQEEGASNCSDP